MTAPTTSKSFGLPQTTLSSDYKFNLSMCLVAYKSSTRGVGVALDSNSSMELYFIISI